MVIGFLTLWVKLWYGVQKVDEAAKKAKLVEEKLDANTVITHDTNSKTATIVRQTNGTMDHMRLLLVSMDERVKKLEEYNHDSAHRVIDALNTMRLRIAEMAALQPKPAIPVHPAVVLS